MITIDDEELQYLKACETTLFYYLNNATNLCPKCHKTILVKGYICSYCGFDPSITI